MRIALLALLVACSGSSSSVGGDSPEAPLRELQLAASRGDAAALRHAMVSPDRLRKAVTCPSTSTLISDLEHALAQVSEAAEVFKEAAPDSSVKLGAITQTGVTKLAKGDNFRGCTANEPFEVRAYSFKIGLVIKGHADDGEDTGEVIQLDGRWYALLKT